ncbi:MAG: LuxR C-terminal-related transcriptional regulator [Spirochaetales bacterium]|jgi:LuxR family maltose regulon positive regulatory protein|nr:LuxR C-terminal-related transcriptional regulator [Spirochaetales bacterium]
MPEWFLSNVYIAPEHQHFLERPRIDRLLEEAVRKPIVIVSAGAGYGKTQAVHSFLRKHTAWTVWMQFFEQDNTGERFWESFVAAVELINKEGAAKLSKLDFPVTDRQFERYLNIPLKESPPKGRGFFVFDDFHLLHEKTVLRFIERSVTSPFPTITSIFISRTAIPLNLEQFESQGLLARITEEDLRFTEEEMLSYFQLLDVHPAAHTVSSIYYDTEGWAFAIHLAGLALKGAPSAGAYVRQALRSNIFKLIASEIMAPLPPAGQRFLIKLSLIEHLVPDLLVELAADPAVLEWMKGLDSFIRFDTYLNVCHIHHLFLDYLKGRQGELTEYDKKDLWHRTATWCARNNRKLDAITYYEKAGDYGRLIDVVYTLHMMFPNRIGRMLLEIMEKAPPEVYDQIAIAHILRAQIYLTLGMYEKAKDYLALVIAEKETLPPSPAVNRTLMGCYNILGFTGMRTSSYTRDYDYARYFERAKYFYDQSPYEIKPPISVLSLSSYICGVNSGEAGEMERYIEGLAGMVAYAPFSMGGCTCGVDDLARGELYFFRGDLSGAQRLSLQALEKARRSGQYETENRALFYLLRINLARGNHAAIRDILDQLSAQLDQPHYLNRFIYYDIITGWYYAHIGQTDKLAPWLKNDFEESDLNSMVFGLEILVKAWYHFSEKHLPAALAVLGNWESRNTLRPFVLGKIEGKTLEAVCRYQSRDRKGAFAALETAYSLACPNALYMPFIELGKNMRALADAALKNNAVAIPRAWLERVRIDASAYAKKLFAVTRSYGGASAVWGTLNQKVNLSRREREVLKGLFQGMTQKEIAGQSSLSVNTVKSVIRSIYRKLGAVNRADAVRIAAGMEIFEKNHDSPQ